MSSDNDLPHQPDILQQPTLIKNQGIFVCKVIFIALLIINVIFVTLVGLLISAHEPTGTGLVGLGVLVLSLPLAIVDLIALLFYGFKCRPHGKARVISSTALILVSLPLIYACVLFIIVPIVMYFGEFMF